MSCATTLELLSGYMDGELPPESSAQVAEHLTTCDECARQYDATLQTVQRLRAELARDRAPDVLRARVRAAIREEASGADLSAELSGRLSGEHAEPPLSAGPRSRRRANRVWTLGRDRWLPWRVAAAAAVVIAVASSGLTLLATGRGRSELPVAEEVLTSHIRSLMPEHLTDVRSTDQHNVKPWFNGRLDFSPTVPRLDDQGYPLVGGRIDYVDGRPVAVVVYTRRQHVINVFTWPVEGDRAAGGNVARDANPSRETRHGYNILHWRSDGTEYWVASDLNVQELEQFAELLRRNGLT